jgi:hypothetical protein
VGRPGHHIVVHVGRRPRTNRPRGRVSWSSPAIAAPPVRSDTIVVALQSRRSPLNDSTSRQPRTQTYEKAVRLNADIRVVITTNSRRPHSEETPTLAPLEVEMLTKGIHICCQITAKNDQSPFLTSLKGL